MNETQVKDVLTQADQAFGTELTSDSATLAQHARQRAAAGQRRRVELLGSGMLVILLAAGLIGYTQYNRYRETRRLALRQETQKELAALKAEAQYTLALIQSVNQRTERRKQLAALRQRLASLAAETESIEIQDEQLAGKLYQKAQALSTQSDSCNAVKTLYQQIIQTFPNSSYTNQAKQKLSQLDCRNGTHL